MRRRMSNIGRIYTKMPDAFYECVDGTFSDHNRPGACMYHGGLKQPVTPITVASIVAKDAIDVNVNGSLVPLHLIHTDVKRFQNRDEEYSIDSVNRILTAIKEGSFKWELLDKVILWRDPANLKLYVLSGHSRYEAFLRAAKEGLKVAGRSFDKVPAEIVQNASFEQAREIALTSNTLSTKETETERAKYYREQRLKGTTKKMIEQLANKYEGKAASMILNFSYLDPNGAAWDSLRLLESADTTSRNNIKTIADWVGEARRTLDPLTNSHERELFNWLMNGAYGTRTGQISNKKDFLSRVYTTIQRRTNFGIFDAGQPLNIENTSVKTGVEADFDTLVVQAQKGLTEAKKALDEKRADLIRRQATPAQLKDILQQYQNAVIVANQEVIRLQEQRGNVREAARNQGNLFAGAMVHSSVAGATSPGIASPIARTPSIATELFTKTYDHLSTAGYEGRGDFPYNPALDKRKPTYILLPSYDHFFDLKADTRAFVADEGLKKTIDTIKAVAKETQYQTKKIAAYLKAPTLEQSAYNAWHFLKTNVLYKLDVEGKEQIREPNRSWKDRHTGIDCEDFSIFIHSMLSNMGYMPKLDIVAFFNSPNYGHIFPTVSTFCVDVVMDQFNKRPPNITKTMIIERLGAVPQAAQKAPMIAGLGAIAPADQLTIDMIRKQNQLLNGGIAGPANADKRKELRKLRFMILLNGMEEREIVLHIMPHVDDISSKGSYIFKPGTDVESLNSLIETREEIQQLGKLFKSKQQRQAKKADKKAKKAVKKTARKEKKAKNKAAGKGILRKTGKLAKKAVKAVVRFNPVSLAIRNAYLLALRINFARMSSRMKWGYATREQAQAKKLNMAQWEKLVSKIAKTEKIFEGVGGKKENMKAAILKGGKGLSGAINWLDTQNPNTSDLAGIGVVATTTVAAAMPAITATLAILKEIDFKALFAGSDVKDEEESTSEAAQERIEAETEAAPQAAAVNSLKDTLPARSAPAYSPAPSYASSDEASMEDYEPVEVPEESTEDLEAPAEEGVEDFTETAEEIGEDGEPVEEEFENLGSLLTAFQAISTAIKNNKGVADKAKSLAPVLNRRPERNGKVKKTAKKIADKVKNLKKKKAKPGPVPAVNKGFTSEAQQAQVKKTVAPTRLTTSTAPAPEAEKSNTGLIVGVGVGVAALFLLANND